MLVGSPRLAWECLRQLIKVMKDVHKNRLCLIDRPRYRRRLRGCYTPNPPASPSFTANPCYGAPQASSDHLDEEHGNNDSDSTSTSLTYSVSTSTSTTQQESPQHEQRRDQSSPPILGGRPSDTYEGGDDAGDGGGGGDAQSSVLTDEPDAWSSWAKDDISDGTQPVGAMGRRGIWYCYWNE